MVTLLIDCGVCTFFAHLNAIHTLECVENVREICLLDVKHTWLVRCRLPVNPLNHQNEVDLECGAWPQSPKKRLDSNSIGRKNEL